MSPQVPSLSASQLEHETTSISSHASSPDSQRRDSRASQASTATNGSQNQASPPKNHSTPQMNFLQKQMELREQASRDSQVRIGVIFC